MRKKIVNLVLGISLIILISIPNTVLATTITIRVPASTPAGARYNHVGPTAIYRLEIYSPPGLSDLAYSPNYVWQNWPNKPQDWHRWHGGAVGVLKNKEPVWVDGRVSNADYNYPQGF